MPITQQKRLDETTPIKPIKNIIDDIVLTNKNNNDIIKYKVKQNIKEIKGKGLDINHKFTKKDFYEFASVMKPIVLRVLNDKKFPTTAANDIVRQAALESNYGTNPIGTYNLGGIKYYKTTGPNRTYTINPADNIAYTNFDNLYDYADYKVQLLNDRYNALSAKNTNEFINKLHDGKYKYSANKENYQSIKHTKSLDKYLNVPYNFKFGGQVNRRSLATGGKIYIKPSIKTVGKSNKNLTDSEYISKLEEVAKNNYTRWGFNNEDEALLHVLNDHTYDYRGYYNKYPNSKANAKTHWPDEFKTYLHPTFSNESKYSGKKSKFNPNGLQGGTWIGDTFIPQGWQLFRPSFELGGKIYIKPSHRGRLTELKERTGKSEAELYNDGNPAHKKMVVFARNARKWNK